MGTAKVGTDRPLSSGTRPIYPTLLKGADLWHSTGIRVVINGASPVDAPSPGGNDYYTVNGPCGAWEGDCDGNQESPAGLYVSATYSSHAIIDVCEAPH